MNHTSHAKIKQLTKTLVNLLSNSAGSGIGCLDLALIVDCLMLACLGCKFVGFVEETTLSGLSEGASSFEDSNPMIVSRHRTTTHMSTQRTPVRCYSFSKRSNKWLLKWRVNMLTVYANTTHYSGITFTTALVDCCRLRFVVRDINFSEFPSCIIIEACALIPS